MTTTTVECADCLSPDLDIVYGHDCPNESSNVIARTVSDRVNIDPPTRNGNGTGNGSHSTNNKATDKQVAYMIALGVPEHIANSASKASASDHIARILEENKRKGAVVKANGPSEKQISYLESLLSQREHSFTGDVANLSKREASDLIGQLKNAPYRSKAVDTPKTDDSVSDGFYADNRDNVYKVQTSQNGYPYAKLLCGTSFEYSKGAINDLKRKLANGDAERLSIERAAAFGHATGNCMCCGRTLRNPESVRAGIGPICAGRL